VRIFLTHANKGNIMAKTEIVAKIKPNLKISEPSFYKVFYINDDVTTMNYVVESLVNFFNYTAENAILLTTTIHDNGSAVVAVLPYEIAEQKGIEVTIDARKQGFPLQVKIESET
jgi:ATP-dependent Clp protease adaptor protein ClpS